MLTTSFQNQLNETLGEIEKAGLYKKERQIASAQDAEITLQDGRRVLNMCANNYLGLSNHPEVCEAARQAISDYGFGLASVRFICGTQTLHRQLEEALSAYLGTEDTILYPSCFDANGGLFETLLTAEDAVISDSLNHASIIDGARLARAEVAVFRHGDVESFAETLAEVRPRARRILVVVDGVYSMDGDVAPIAEIVKRAHERDAFVLLDDAHGTGTLGPRGRGTGEAAGVLGEIDIVMGTLGKSLGSFGAFVAGSAKLRELLVNTARSFIFSCALAPAQVEAARVALRLVDEEPWRRERLQTRCDRLRDRLAAAGISTAPSTTHVLPVLLGDNARTMAVCERLLERGYYAQGIRHPSVPHGTARLRITPMATHEDAEIDGLAEAIVGIVAELPGEPPIQPLTDPRAGTPTSTPAKPGPAAGRGSRSERAAAPTGPTGAC